MSCKERWQNHFTFLSVLAASFIHSQGLKGVPHILGSVKRGSLFSTLHPPLPRSYFSSSSSSSHKQRSFLHCTYYDNPITYWYSSKKMSENIFFLDSIVPSFAGGGLVNCSAENAESSSQVVVHDGGDSSCCSVAKYGSRASSQISIPGLDWDSQVNIIIMSF